MPFATTPEQVQLYYETLGTGEPLLLIAGQGNDHHVWAMLREDFAHQYQVIVYDHRGTGQSDKPEQPPYSTRGFAQDAVAILDHLGISRAHVFGISMGGRIGQWLGIDYPDRVGALVLGCTTPGNAHGVRRSSKVDAVFNDSGKSPIAAIKMMSYVFSPFWALTHLNFLKGSASDQIMPEYAKKLHYETSENHDAWAELPRISAPTLVIHGSNDQMNPTANAPLMANRIPNAELYIVKGGRHLFIWEYRDESVRVIKDFLARRRLNP